MDATIEEFGKLYPAYATLYFKDECEIVETAPKSGKVAIEDVAYLDAGMSKISHMAVSYTHLTLPTTYTV